MTSGERIMLYYCFSYLVLDVIIRFIAGIIKIANQ